MHQLLILTRSCRAKRKLRKMKVLILGLLIIFILEMVPSLMKLPAAKKSVVRSKRLRSTKLTMKSNLFKIAALNAQNPFLTA